MTLRELASRALPRSAKRLLRRRTPTLRLARILSPHLPELVCVDVGASYFPHTKWELFLSSPATRWVAVEPNKENLGYLDAWPWEARVRACTTGLSSDGGTQTLFVTNVDSGSSLLEPRIPDGMTARVVDLDYFFPVTPRDIDTITLEQAIGDDAAGGAPVFVKLDTQGSELSILAGASSMFERHQLVGIEMEATLLAQPLMQGSGRLWEACQFLEERGFELLEIRPFYGPSRYRNRHLGGHTYLNECDAVFALRPDVAAGLDVTSRVALLAFHLSYQFYEEAVSSLERDHEVESWLRSRGCDVAALLRSARA